MDNSIKVAATPRQPPPCAREGERPPGDGAKRSVVTNAASTGVRIDRKRLKKLASRNNRPGIAYLAAWATAMLLTGIPVWLTLGTVWVRPSMFVHGVVLTVPTYSLSHETAHGTAFRTRWFNEAVFWISSLLYGEEPLHRRYTHTNHHTYTYTWHVGLDLLRVVVRRSLGRNTKAAWIRQAPHMVTDGTYSRIAKATMQ